MGILNDVGDGPTDDFTSLQLAIADVDNGGTVRGNASGALNEYAEDLTVNNKRVTLYGSLPAQGVRVVGTGGAAPSLLVTGTGGVTCANMYFSNAGTTATYIVEGNVDEDWFDSVVVNGGGAVNCLQAQWLRNCLAYDGLTGVISSCGGMVMALSCTVVNMTVAGITSVSNGFFQSCLAYNCAGAGFTNYDANQCDCNAAGDSTAPGPVNMKNVSLAQIAFRNYAGKDFRLNYALSLVWFRGVTMLTPDGLNARRLRNVFANRLYPGYHDPFPGAPTFNTLASRIREL